MKHKPITIACCILMSFLIHAFPINAQQSYAIAPPNPTAPSANATALGIYGQYPISYSSGTPEINIPLYEVKGKHLSVPVSLSFHANGIKVNEFASQIGLGWSLNASGAITRVINQFDDFDGSYGFGDLVIPKQARTQNEGSSPYDEEMMYYQWMVTGNILSSGAQYDAAPDNFYFNFPGNTGLFLLKNAIAKGAPYVFSTIPYKPFKINYNRENGGQFIINDDNGDTYVFGRSIKDGSGAIEQTSSPQTGHPSNYSMKPTAWYLTEIISADQTDTIFFKYILTNEETIYYTNNSITRLKENIMGTWDVPSPHVNQSEPSEHSVQNLSEIQFSSGKVIFEYGTRQDHGGQKLSAIRIYQNYSGLTKEIKNFSLEQSYFTSSYEQGQISTDVINSRLRLDKVQENGIDPISQTIVKKTPYTFLYYGDGKIATIGSYQQDLWGYWNGDASNNSLIIGAPTGTMFGISNRTPNSQFLQAGNISEIQYPTGGKTTFQFEPNKTAWVHTVYDTTFKTYHLSNLGDYGPNTDVTFTVGSNFSLNGKMTVNFNYSISNGPGTDLINNQPYIYLMDLTTGSSNNLAAYGNDQSQPMPRTGSVSVTLDEGHKYRFYLDASGVPNNPVGNYRYYINASLNKIITAIESVERTDTVLTGGLRVANIVNLDREGAVTTQKTFKYLNPYYISPDIFSGDFNNVASRFQYPYMSPNSPTGTQWVYTYSENFTVPLAGASNGSLYYQEVEEYSSDRDGNSIGKTVYDFNKATDDEYFDVVSTKTDNTWMRNQLLSKKEYKYEKPTYILLKESKYTYSSLFAELGDTIKTWDVHPKFFDGVDRAASELSQNRVVDQSLDGGTFVDVNNQYYCYSCDKIIYRNALTNTIVTEYSTSGLVPIVTTTDLFYNKELHPVRIETTRSNGGMDRKRISYNTDLYRNWTLISNNCYQTFQDQVNQLKADYYTNITPIYNQYVQKRGDETLYNSYRTLLLNYYTSVQNALNLYNQCISDYKANYSASFASASLSDKALLQMRQVNKIAQTQTTYSVSSPVDNVEYLVRADSIQYQAVGSVSEPSKMLSSELNGKVPYNTFVSNRAKYLRDKINYKNFHSGQLSEYADQSQNYTYLWGYNGQYPVAKVLGSDYTTVISKVSQSTLDNPATTESAMRSELDKVRKAFSGNPVVQVWTYTYSPLFGMMSETDPKGATTFYEYDGFGRLMYAKDKDGNMLKKYDYHYGGQ